MSDRIQEIRALYNAAQNEISRTNGHNVDEPCITISMYNSIDRKTSEPLRTLASRANRYIPYLLDLVESLQREEPPLQQCFALACRILADTTGICPQNVFETGWGECEGEAEQCGDRDMWKCWQKFINETIADERVCRVCGCTENNACTGKGDNEHICCYWIEEDLCSACATETKGDAT